MSTLVVVLWVGVGAWRCTLPDQAEHREWWWFNAALVGLLSVFLLAH